MDIDRAHLQLRSWKAGTIATVCECGEWRSHRIEDLRKGFPATTPVDSLPSILTCWCKREGGCLAEYVSPDDGCAEGG